jgi:hypothetical protein
MTKYRERSTPDDPLFRPLSWKVNVETAVEAFRASVGNVAVIDCAGRIIAANRGWLGFAREHGGRFKKIGPGANYLKVCQTAMQLGDHEASVALNGIIRVLDGSLSTFCLEYCCLTPYEELWFRMIVLPLCRREGGALITHLLIHGERAIQRQSPNYARDRSPTVRLAPRRELGACVVPELMKPPARETPTSG